jgi:putative transposase
MCHLLGVSRSGYYAWLSRAGAGLGGRAGRDQELVDQIGAIHAEFAYYGSPRIYQVLRARAQPVGRHRVARLMQVNGIRARRGKIKSRPRSAPPARRPEITDRVRRIFHAAAPDRLWFTDITQIRTGQGWLFAALILDAFNREVVSWAVEDHDSPRTVLRALAEAITIRRPPAGCVIHSDRGYQFTSADWLNLAAGHGLQLSIGERKSALDNATMESWFASLKNEEIYPNGQPTTRAEARARLFTYIWTYNTKRLHSSLGFMSPRTYARTASICP